jgi:hypothetical protein
MNDHTDPMQKAQQYGVSLWDTHSVEDTAALRESVDHSVTVDWTDRELRRVLRFRLIGCSREYPFWDVSYCYGELRDGTRVRVQLPFGQLKRTWQSDLLEHAKRAGVYAKALGFFDADVYSTLHG